MAKDNYTSPWGPGRRKGQNKSIGTIARELLERFKNRNSGATEEETT
jgi:hypothetical protein